MWYTAVGWTTERADHGPTIPMTAARLETCCRRSPAPGHRRHSLEGRGANSGESSPVSTQERVSGSLRSSMLDFVGRELSHAGFYDRAAESNNHKGHEGT